MSPIHMGLIFFIKKIISYKYSFALDFFNKI